MLFCYRYKIFCISDIVTLISVSLKFSSDLYTVSFHWIPFSCFLLACFSGKGKEDDLGVLFSFLLHQMSRSNAWLPLVFRSEAPKRHLEVLRGSMPWVGIMSRSLGPSAALASPDTPPRWGSGPACTRLLSPWCPDTAPPDQMLTFDQTSWGDR